MRLGVQISSRELYRYIKYIFGYKSIYGAFEEFIFDPKDSGKLQK